MSTGRLTFLYPPLLRATVRVRARRPSRAVATGTIKCKSTFARHGKAVEPLILPLQNPKDALKPPAASNQDTVKSVDTVAVEAATEGQAEARTDDPAESTSTTTKAEGASGDEDTEASKAANKAANKAKREEEDRARQAREEAKQSGPLEAVLHMQPPEKVAKQHPSMSPPPYVHHFDSYSLVKQLQDGGYSQPQATTAMKGIRSALAKNLDVAQASLVSKSDVENVRRAPGRTRRLVRPGAPPLTTPL